MLNAEHDNSSSVVGKSSETARKLSSRLRFSIEAKIISLWNVNISVGLVNGSIGYIKDFIR